MRRLPIALSIAMLTAVSCMRQEQMGTMEQQAGQENKAVRGISVRTTQRISDDEFTVTEKYTLADGGAMEDRVGMT